MFKGAHFPLRWKLRNLLSPKTTNREKRQRRVLLELEELETRALLSASVVTPVPLPSPVEPPSGVVQSLLVTPEQSAATTAVSGYTPAQIRQAYGVQNVANNTNVTIAIVDASYDPTLLSDVAAFDSHFGLQSFGGNGPTLSQVSGVTVGGLTAGTTLTSSNAPALFGEDPNWAMETALDVEWAHAIDPSANIVLVEAPLDSDNNQQLTDLTNAVAYAGGVANTVSMSWGFSEFTNESSYDNIFTTPKIVNNVTFVAASGDSSAFFGPIWPATSPYVLAVGGTGLQTTTSGTNTAYKGETGWFGSGGGYAAYEGEPSFQTNTLGVTDSRLTPDVAFDANPNTGVAIYDSFQQSNPWIKVGGTSVGSPVWAGIVALADQQRGSSLGTYQVETTLYNTTLATSSGQYGSGQYAKVFHDITRGTNGYAAGAGYDLVTGLGSPKVNNLVPLLAKSTPPATSLSISGSGTGGFSSSSSSFGGFARGTQGGGLYSHASGPSITLSSAEAAGASGNSATVPAISALNAPLSTTVPVLSGSVPSANNNILGSINLTTQGTQPALGSNSVNLIGSSDAPIAQSGTVFGASGWSGVGRSWLLSSHGLHGPTIDRLTSDLADSLPEREESLLDTDSSDDEAPLFDMAAPVVLDGTASEGGESGEGGE
ncbi:MAG TPA: S53 family peptidase [Gemmataceae bacterium]|nr:S53 family peptidase [Gemmataceae bacterium]